MEAPEATALGSNEAGSEAAPLIVRDTDVHDAVVCVDGLAVVVIAGDWACGGCELKVDFSAEGSLGDIPAEFGEENGFARGFSRISAPGKSIIPSAQPPNGIELLPSS